MGSDTRKLGVGRLIALMHGPIYATRLRELVRSIVPHQNEKLNGI